MTLSTVETALDFSDLKPIEIPILIGADCYILREATASTARAFRATMTSNIRMGPNGRPQEVDGKITGAEPALVGSSLFKILKKPDGPEETSKRPVGQSFIDELPDRVQAALFEKLKEISPTLYSSKKDTVESITKEIEKLQSKLEKLKAKEEDSKNS